MITDYFKKPQTIEILQSSLAGPYLNDFAAWLKQNGYSHQMIRRKIRNARKFSEWADKKGLTIDCCNTTALDAFSKYLSSRKLLKYENGNFRHIFLGARHFVDFLELSDIAKKSIQLPVDETPPIIHDFSEWMQSHRGIKKSTLKNYRRGIEDLLSTLGDQPERYNAKQLREFIIKCSHKYSIDKTKNIVTSVRMFLRFLIAVGKCDPILKDVIPTIAHWRLSSLPKYLSSEDVKRIINGCDTSIALGARDKAILLLLSRLGLRAGDVAYLKIDDIDWNGGTVLVSGKNRKECKLPLPQDVGDAILCYLKFFRPKINSANVFITTQAPHAPVSRQLITSVAAKAIRRAKIKAPSYGSHIFRNSAATAMLQQGFSLHSIGRLLRHSSVETTAIYAKVDLDLLKVVVRPWPKEVK